MKNKNDKITLEDVKQQIRTLQEQPTSRSFANDNTNSISMEELEKEVQELFKSADKIRRSVDIKDEDNFLKKMTRFLPFGDKILDKVDDKIHDKTTLREYVDKFMSSIDKTVNNANKYLEQVENRADVLERMIEEGDQILALIDKAIVQLKSKEDRTRQENKELNRWVILKTNLGGIQNSNHFSYKQAEDAAKITYGMTENMATLRPIIKQTLETQTEIISHNHRNKAMIESLNVGKELINAIQIQNQKDSGKLMRETVKIATDPLIEEETLKKLQIGFETDHKKFNQLLLEQGQKIAKYNQQVAKNKRVLIDYRNLDTELQIPELKYEEEK